MASEKSLRPSVRTVESLGKVTYEVKPSPSNLVAGVIISLLMMGGGLGVSGLALRTLFGGIGPQTQSNRLGAAGMVLLGLGVFVGGAFLLRWVNSLFGFRLRVCRDGFYFFMRGGVETVFAWEEIVRVRETVLHERLPLVKGAARALMPTIKSRKYEVVRCDGEVFHFDQNIIPRTSLLAGPLSSAAKVHGFAWDTTEETA